jgi:hypothetical protein
MLATGGGCRLSCAAVAPEGAPNCQPRVARARPRWRFDPFALGCATICASGFAGFFIRAGLLRGFLCRNCRLELRLTPVGRTDWAHGARGFFMAHAPTLLRQPGFKDGFDAVGPVTCCKGLSRHGFPPRGVSEAAGQFQHYSSPAAPDRSTGP